MEKSSKNLRFTDKELKKFLEQSLYWANTQAHFSYLCPDETSYPEGSFDHILFVGSKSLQLNQNEPWNTLNECISNTQKNYAGHFSYELKNQIEGLSSKKPKSIDAPIISFFEADTIIKIYDDNIEISTSQYVDGVIEEIKNTTLPKTNFDAKPIFSPRISKEDYIKTVQDLRNHIIEGDIYEINYCYECFSENVAIDPIHCFLNLKKRFPAPFSVLYKCQNQYVICGSPERFLKKEGSRLLSQPIKGTARRGQTISEDLEAKYQLQHSEKEKAENMMIVDLVRNDLARSCISGSIKVDEIFGIYSFPMWHQMISTVSGQLNNNTTPIEAIQKAFPMGSMTGAPKHKVMQLIDRYENVQRGYYSGAIGYFDEDGNFDFNVVIRSLVYDSQSHRCTFHVGSAITYDSIPENEYEECLLKSKTLTALFKN